MPANSTGTIAVNKDVSTYVASTSSGGFNEFSPQDSTVRFRSIPANVASVGLKLVLPDNPSDGDSYSFVDADGSCDAAHVILATIADAGATGRTFGGIGGGTIPGLVTPADVQLIFAQSFTGATFTFDAAANEWLVEFSNTPAASASLNIAGTVVGGAPVAPDNFAGGAAEILFAFLVNPRSTGTFRLDTLFEGILAAADTDMKLEITVVPNVTAFSGGGQVGGATAPTMRYVSGSPVVVTGGAPVVWGDVDLQEATGNIGHVSATLATLVAVPKPTLANTIGAAIVVKLSTTAQAINTIKLAANVQEAA